VILLDVEGVAASRPDRPLFRDVSFTLSDGERLRIVGRNGSGKTTLLRILSGALTTEQGVVRRGREARLVVLDQDPPLPPGTVAEVLGHGWEIAALADRLGLRDLLGTDIDTLSGGQRKRVALCRALASLDGEGSSADVLVLDEPTNHLDLESINALNIALQKFEGTVLLVTHDQDLMEEVGTRVWHFDGRGITDHKGAYEEYAAAIA